MSAVSHTNLPPFSACCLNPSKPEHRWSRLRCSPLRLTTAAGAGSRDCALRLHYRFLPTPLLRHGVGPLSLRLRQQTLFKGYSNALSRHRSYVAVSGASLYPLPRNLRLLFRLVRTGIFTPSSGRRTAAVRHHPPAHKRTDERTMFSQWHIVYRPFGQNGLFASGASAYCQATPRSGGLYSQPRTAYGARHRGVGHCRSASPTTKSCLYINYATPLCAVCSGSPSNPFSAPSAPPFALPTQRPTHIDNTPSPDPDVRTAEALTPFRLSVNLSTHSASGRSRWTLPTPHTHFRRCSVALRSSEKCSPTSGVSEATLTDNAEFPTLL